MPYFFRFEISSCCWWRDVIRESTFDNSHTTRVLVGLKWGMVLFIVSEIMFFFAFFWAFFYFSINPAMEIGGVWPPLYITILNPFEVPLLNTILLLSSGATLTWAHHSIVLGSKYQAVVGMLLTIFLVSFQLFISLLRYANKGNRKDSVLPEPVPEVITQ